MGVLESDHYAHFMSRGIETYLRNSSLVPLHTEMHLWGAVQIIVCRN